jgi:hypothetical protein
MAECPYCDLPASAWRMWRVTRWSGYRCGGCRKVSRVPGGQLTWMGLLTSVATIPAALLAGEAARPLGPVVKYCAVVTVATIVTSVCAYVMSRKCDLVPPERATPF